MKKVNSSKFKYPLILFVIFYYSLNLYSQIEESRNDTLLSMNDFTRITDTNHNKYYFEFSDSITKAIFEHKCNLDTNNLFYFNYEEPFIDEGYITFHIWTVNAINDFINSQKKKYCESKPITIGPYGGLIQGDLYIKFHLETKRLIHIYQIE